VKTLKNFLAFYGTRTLITVSTRALHWSLFWVEINSVHTTPDSLSKIHFNIIHPSSSWSELLTASLYKYESKQINEVRIYVSLPELGSLQNKEIIFKCFKCISVLPEWCRENLSHRRWYPFGLNWPSPLTWKEFQDVATIASFSNLWSACHFLSCWLDLIKFLYFANEATLHPFPVVVQETVISDLGIRHN
jgi:hypothetical protein